MWFLQVLLFLLTMNLTFIIVSSIQLQSFLEKFQFDVIFCHPGQSQLHPNFDTDMKKTRIKNQYMYLECDNDASRQFLWTYLFYYRDRDPSEDIAIVYQPEDTLTAFKFLIQLSQFYKKMRDEAAFVYFFIAWPEFDDISSTLRNTQSFNYSLTDADLPLNSRCYLFQNGSESYSSPVINFWEFYSIKGMPVIQSVNISHITDFVQIIQRRSDFRGVTITAIAKRENSLPILVLFKDINGSEFLVGGLAVEMMSIIADKMNFSLKVLKARGWISELPDGTVGGMGKQLVDKKADMTLQYSDLLEYRLKNLGISQPTYRFRVHAYFRKPLPSLSRNIYVDAFKINLRIAVWSGWILILISLLSIAYYKKRWQEHFSELDDKVVDHVFLWIIGTICQKGWEYSPSSASLRVIVFSSLLSGLLYYTAYSASIVAIFSVEVNPFREISDLVKRGFTIYGNELSVATYQYVQDRAREDGVSGFTRILSPSEGMREIEKYQSAFLSSGSSLIPFAQKANYTHLDLCTWLSLVDAGMSKQSTVIYFQKYDPLQKFINYRLTGWREKGLLFRQNSDYDRMATPSCIEMQREPTALGFQDIKTAFYTLILGLLLCFTILVYEIISFLIWSENYKKNNTYFYA